MIKRNDNYFRYPPNLNMLDLATLVSLYRSRGEPVKSAAGDYFGCAHSFKLVREAKTWFGLHYSQASWDAMLTKDAQGYPLTEAEMNVLGLASGLGGHPQTREFIEKNIGVIPQLGYMIVNDLKTFGFVEEQEGGTLSLSSTGEDALNGIAKRIYEKKFIPEMLQISRERYVKPTPTASKDVGDKLKGPQIDLF
ncbi:MAG: hypothetical protein JJU41_09610 [Bacteroidetes bacterium]|nr:hypothetical protein [Bacteroidota bacterium]MCH8524588.1 hypothetical protein [Balneolales bacterium]